MRVVWVAATVASCSLIAGIAGYVASSRSILGFLEISDRTDRTVRVSQAQQDLEALRALRQGNQETAIGILTARVDRHLRALESIEEEPEVPPELLDELRAYLDENPSKGHSAHPYAAELFSSAAIAPVYESGSMVGIRVSRVRPDSRWQEIGLSDDDVIVAFDEARLDSPAAVSRFFEAIMNTVELSAVYLAPGRVRLISSSR